MLTSAKLSKLSFSFLLLNLILVLGVAALRPVFAKQDAVEQKTTEPDVELPPGEAPNATSASSTAKQSALDSLPADPIPTSASGTSPAPVNPMVLDAIRQAIQDNHGDLDVPPLSYPALAIGSGSKPTAVSLEDSALRMKSIAAVTQSAQALIKEAQYRQAKGQSTEAAELMEQVQTLKSIIVQLASPPAATR